MSFWRLEVAGDNARALELEATFRHERGTLRPELNSATPRASDAAAISGVYTLIFARGYSNAINHPWLGMVNIPTINGDDWGLFTIVIPTLLVNGHECFEECLQYPDKIKLCLSKLG